MNWIIGKGITVSTKADYLKVTLIKPMHESEIVCMVISTVSVWHLSGLWLFSSKYRSCLTVGNGLLLRESEIPSICGSFHL